MIMACTCTHEFRNATYGAGNRVFNRGKKDDNGTLYRCTVCKHTVKLSGNKEDKGTEKAKKGRK